LEEKSIQYEILIWYGKIDLKKYTKEKHVSRFVIGVASLTDPSRLNFCALQKMMEFAYSLLLFRIRKIILSLTIIISDKKDYFIAKPFNEGARITDNHLVNTSKSDEDLYLLNQIAKNDGLSVSDFKDWFKDRQFVGVIIHLTNFRY